MLGLVSFFLFTTGNQIRTGEDIPVNPQKLEQEKLKRRLALTKVYRIPFLYLKQSHYL